MRKHKIQLPILDAAFFMLLVVMAVMFFSWLAYKDCAHAEASELRMSGVYGVK